MIDETILQLRDVTGREIARAGRDLAPARDGGMNDMTQRTELSPAKRALREARLRGQYRAPPITRRAREADPRLSFPQALVRLDALPLTPNGKLDCGALPAPGAEAYATRGYEAPAGETEAELAEIWSALLRVERVGRQDNFFALGGHSLLVLQVIEGMRARGYPAEAGALFATPVLADLAAATDGIEEVRL